MPLVTTSQAKAANVTLVFEQGTDFVHVIGLKNSDGTIFVLTGYSARMQIRETISSVNPVLELTTANGRISINGSAGQLTLSVTNADTSAFTWRSGVYDLEIISGSNVVTRIMQGNATVSLEVTR